MSKYLVKKLDRLLELARWQYDDQIGLDEKELVELEKTYQELRTALRELKTLQENQTRYEDIPC